MSEAPDTKPGLRQRILKRRDALIPVEREQKSSAIAANGAAALTLLIQDKKVSGYYAIRSEVDISHLLLDLEKAGAKLCLPAVLDRETIVFRSFHVGDNLVPGGFGTMAPDEAAVDIYPDVLLMPLSVFDNSGNRIGYGAGHYDRAIERFHQAGHKPILVGVAFDLQEVSAVPAEPHDVPLDGIITESGMRWFSSSRRTCC